MELTRRDAMAALAALGGAGGVAVAVSRRPGGGSSDDGSDEPLPGDERVQETLVAVAEVVYPEALSGVGTFVESFLGSRLEAGPHATGLREAVATLNERGERWHGGRVADLSPDVREQLLRETGADTAEEDPDGTDAERVRYYVVNELLLALYASPTGGELVGIENPQGHPGGTGSYQQGPL
ncbi:MAG: hypothetical protein J07HX64_01905 [halophilic archaeon J07HX64]|jgi:hypothetical protein|nr:MAG: hypothetical protein J07HX64_01905 [halophilic archaeon J07HX64]